MRCYVSREIGKFHALRFDKLEKLKFDHILKRGNPYLHKVKHLEVAHDFVKIMMDNYLALQERTMFGHFLEELAIFVGNEICNARKSGIEGVDLEFERGGIHYIVSIKSGPNWGNSNETIKQKELFKKASKIIRQSKSAKAVRAVIGCCYGRDKKSDKGDYDKFCGQDFWEFLSQDNSLYLDIIEPLGHQSKKRNDDFNKKYAQLINKITADFSERFCVDGVIDWRAVVQFSSGRIE